MTLRAELLVDAAAILAEGPVWDDWEGHLVFVDILRGKIHRARVDGSSVSEIDMGEHVGAVALTSDGGMLAATRSGIRLVDSLAGHPLLVPMPTSTDRGRPTTRIRMNDGKCDPRGRFVVGSKADDDSPGVGTLWHFEGAGLRPVLTGVTISNGLAWSDDGSTLYYVDTPTGRIDRYDYDLNSGTVGNRRTEVEIPADRGRPDGLTIDQQGGLWIALWGGAAVHRYDRGVLSEIIEVPATYTTSCTFGGENLGTLLITSAKDESTGRLGAIHAIELETGGFPPVRFDANMTPDTIERRDSPGTSEATAELAPDRGWV